MSIAKKYFFIVSISIILEAILYAQYNENRFFITLSAGVTGCQVHGDKYSGYNKLGWTGGILVQYKWFQNIIPQLGINYIQKGARHNPDSADMSQYLVKLHYTEIPVNIKFIFLKRKIFLTLGHSVAYLFRYYEEINYINITSTVKNEKFEFSINTGIGYNINNKINIELRANNGYKPFRYFTFPSNIYYNNPIARLFNKGLYNNILELILTYNIYATTSE